MKLSRTLIALVVFAGSIACTENLTREQQWKQVIDAIPWMMQVLEYCDAFEATKSDADRADIVGLTYGVVKNVSVTAVRGSIETLLPKNVEQPDSFSLQVLVGERVRFASQSGKRVIDKGSPVYAQVAALEEGQCVIFSADSLEPIGPFQRDRVCTPRYYARFSDVRPCK